jgi:hypothetical protein
MTSEELGEMFEGDSADMCYGKFPLVLMGGQMEGLACASEIICWSVQIACPALGCRQKQRYIFSFIVVKAQLNLNSRLGLTK